MGEVDAAKPDERATLEDTAAIEAEPDDDSAMKERIGFVEEAEEEMGNGGEEEEEE